MSTPDPAAKKAAKKTVAKKATEVSAPQEPRPRVRSLAREVSLVLQRYSKKLSRSKTVPSTGLQDAFARLQKAHQGGVFDAGKVVPSSCVDDLAALKAAL